MKERRFFKRYPVDSHLTVKINDKPMDARVTDYSIEGVGLLVEDHPVIHSGDTISISMDHPSIKKAAKIMWKESLKSLTRIGLFLDRPIEGSLEDFQISDVLIGLQRASKTGTLEFKSGAVLKNLYLDRGEIVFAASNLAEESFSGILLREGKITAEDYDAVAELHAATGKKHGTILVEKGILKANELFNLLKHRVEEIILSLFIYEKGDFGFREGPVAAEDTVKLKLSAARLIYKGLKRIDDLEKLRRECPKYEEIVGLSEDPLDLFQDIQMDEEDKHVLVLLDGKSRMKDILRASPLSEVETMKAIYAFISTRIAEVKETSSEQDVTPEEILKKKPVAPDVLMKNINEMYEKSRRLNYFELLGLSRNANDIKLGLSKTATDSEVKRAYYGLAKEFHPDLHFNLGDDVNAKLTAIFSTITDAYSTLKTAEGRVSYIKSLESPGKTSLGPEAARKKFREAIISLEKGSLKEAEALFGEAAYLDGTSSEYRYYYGLSLSRQRKFREAERELKRAQQKDPDNSDILAELGHVYLGMGFPTRAQTNFERALRQAPGNLRASEGIKLMKNHS